MVCVWLSSTILMILMNFDIENCFTEFVLQMIEKEPAETSSPHTFKATMPMPSVPSTRNEKEPLLAWILHQKVEAPLQPNKNLCPL